MSDLAARHKVTIHAGSVVEREGNNHYNTTLVFGPTGEEIARYRKMHLFDVDIAGGISYRESDTISRGEEVVTYKVGETTVGCAICYDIRFPELFRKLRDNGSDVIVLPAAFTLMTGKDHWEILQEHAQSKRRRIFSPWVRSDPIRMAKNGAGATPWSSIPGDTSLHNAPIA